MRGIKVVCSVFFLAVAVVAFASGGWAAVRSPGDGKSSPAQAAVAAQLFSKRTSLQSPFIKNDNQIKDESVKYYARMSSGTVFVTGEGIVYTVYSGDKENRRGWTIREQLLNANETPAAGLKPSPTRVSYFRGNDPSGWRSSIPAFEEVGFRDVYKGVSLRLRAYGGSAEKIFEIDKGGDPEAIAVKVEGALGLGVNAAGELELETGLGKMRMTAPLAYQESDGKRTTVKVSYRVSPEEKTYGFLVGEYNRELPLVIDPSLLASTYIGGGADDVATSIALARDGSGDILIAGYSTSADYPGTPGAYQPVHNDVETNGCGLCELDIFVSRFNSDLTALRASTFLGGTWHATNSCATCNWEIAHALSIDSSGNIYVAGETNAEDFPTTPGVYKTSPNDADAFISRFNSDLSELLASTYFGGVGWDVSTNMAIDGSGRIYVTGGTNSPGLFPEGAGYDTSKNWWNDVFVAAFDPDLTTLIAGTYLGGSGEDYQGKLTLDGAGNIFVTGSTRSADFPTTSGAFDETYNGIDGSTTDVFVSKLDAGLKNLLASTFLGGASADDGADVAVNGSGAVFVAGSTGSNDFPVTAGAFDTTLNWGLDVFVSKFDPGLTRLLASTYIGGGWFEGASSLALDPSGYVYVAGNTGSDNFPVTIDAYNGLFNLGAYAYDVKDAFVCRLDNGLTNLTYSTFLGGTSSDYANAIAFNGENTFTVAGQTASTDFPTTETAYDTTYNGWTDAFVAKMKIPENLWVEVVGSNFIPPGGQGEFLVKYKSTLSVEAQDVVVLIDLPQQLELEAVSEGGIYYSGSGCGTQVFWKLGKLSPGAEGELTFKATVPWGTPLSDVTIGARIGAANYAETAFDLTPYLAFVPRQIASVTDLTKVELSTLLATDQPLRDLLNASLAMGYYFFDVATRVVLEDGEQINELFLLDPKGTPAILSSSGGQAKGVVLQGDRMTLFDAAGGFDWDSNQGTFDPWGSWASAAPLASAMDDETSVILGGTPWAKTNCLFNCMVEKVPMMVLKKVFKPLDLACKGITAAQCLATIAGGDPDPKICASFMETITAERWKAIGPGLGDAVDAVLDIQTCSLECAKDPSSHICKGSVRTCCDMHLGALTGNDGWCERGCNLSTGIYAPVETKGVQCNAGQVCEKGQCTDPCWENPQNDIEGLDPPCNKKKLQVRVAHDPNAKSADLKGDVTPGERITYTIDYENMGDGTAFSVFVLDKLPAQLDDSSLEIGNGGEYSPKSRLLSWDMGDLVGHQMGQVSFSVQVKPTVAAGTQITNYATVHFPSADEVTPTNPVVHVVALLAANPQRLAGTAGEPLAISLSGQGPEGMSYVIVGMPKFGSLTGTPPDVVYTPDLNFSGLDTLVFQVEKGLLQSGPAEITLEIAASPLDVTPPQVVRVYPEKGSTAVPVNAEPLNIEAVFNEPLDPASVNTTTFTVSGLSGTVSYDEALWKAVFSPAAPLTEGQTYTATIQTGATDMAGNGLSEPYTWSFSTAGSASISVALPAGLSALKFGAVMVNKVKSQIVSITNRGSGNLHIGQVKISGTDAALFSFSSDPCSNSDLGPSANCIVSVRFAPDTAGVKSAMLSIPSNDPMVPNKNISMRGTATAGKPDLTGRWTALTQTCSDTACKVSGTLAVTNGGIRPAGPFLVRIYRSKDALFDKGDQLVKEKVINILKRKATLKVPFTLNVPGGASGDRFIGVLDPTKAVVERNEVNNTVVSEPVP